MSVILFKSAVDGTEIRLPERVESIVEGKGLYPAVTTKAALPDMRLTGDCIPLEDTDGNWLRDRSAKPLCGQMVQQGRYDYFLGTRVEQADADRHHCDLYPVFKATQETFVVGPVPNFGTFKSTGKVTLSIVPAPDLVQPADDEPLAHFDSCFTPVANGGAYLIDYAMVADPYLGFTDAAAEERIFVENQEFGIEQGSTLSILAEMLPNFSFSGSGRNVRATCNANITFFDANKQSFVTRTCTCDIRYSEFAMQSADRDGSDRANMEAFTLALAAHKVDYHEGVTSEMMCEHGERNHVQSRSRATGQKFSASFCKRGQSKTACDPVWHNSESASDANYQSFRGTTQAEYDRQVRITAARAEWGIDLADGTADLLGRAL